MDEFVEAIDEQIEDDNKIVTYKSLSFSLALPIQKSKEVLTHYFQAKKDTSLKACYLLTGKTKTGIQIRLVHFDDLEEEKEKFESLISSHIYSVQKTKLKTSADLYNADYDAIKAATESNQRYGLITYAGSKELTAEEIAKARVQMQENRGKKEDTLQQSFPKSTKTKTPTQKKSNAFSLFTPKTTSKRNEAEDKVKKEGKEADEKEVKKESPNATETATKEKAKTKDKDDSKSKSESSSSSGKKKKASTSSMMKFMSTNKTDPFAGLQSSQKSIKKEKESPKEVKKETKKETKKPAPSNNVDEESPPKPRAKRDVVVSEESEEEETKIDSPKKEQKKETTIDSPKKPKKKEPKVNSPKKEQKQKTAASKPKKEPPVKRKKKQISDDSDDEMSISINEIKKNSKRAKGEPTKRSTKKKKAKKDEKKVVRRSRIVTDSSSDSEEEMSVEEEEPKAATPVKPRGPVIKVGSKCKRRVLKSHTYVDADGSMLTEKVYEEVSCSDDDNEENKKDVIPATPEPVKKKPVPFSKPPASKKSKQSSLTSFFTKK